MRYRWMKATLVVAALGVAGCGDGSTEVAGSSDVDAEVGGSSDVERYCELQRDLADGFDAEKLDELAVVAPPEISEEIVVLVEAGKIVTETGDHDALEAVAEQEAAMHAFNVDRCGIPNPLEEE